MDPFKKSLGINFGPLFSVAKESATRNNNSEKKNGAELSRFKHQTPGNTPKPDIDVWGGYEVIGWVWVSTSTDMQQSGYWKPILGEFVGSGLPDTPPIIPIGSGGGGGGGSPNDPPSKEEEPLAFLEYCRCKINMAGPVAGTINCCSEEKQKKIEDAYKGIMRSSSSIRSDLSKYKGLMECITKTFRENKICCLDPDNRGDANRFDGQSKYVDMDIWVNPSTKEIMVDMSSVQSVVDYLEKLLFAMIYYCSIKDGESNEVGAIIDAVGIVGQITGRYMPSKQFISILSQLGEEITGNGHGYFTSGQWVSFYERWGIFFNEDDYLKKINSRHRTGDDPLQLIIEAEIGSLNDWPITKEGKKNKEKYVKNKPK